MKTFIKNYWGDLVALILVLGLTYVSFGDVLKDLLS